MKAVVFRGLYLGDLVAATGALRALRHGYSGAEITLVSLPWATALFPHLPYVDRLLPYPGAPSLDGWKDDAGNEDLEGFLARARGERFDLAVNLHGRGPASTRLVARFGARRIAGFANEDAPTLDVEVPWDAEVHESRKLLLLAEKVAGLPAGVSGGAEPELRIREEDDRRARALIPTSDPTPSPDHLEVTERALSSVFPDSRRGDSRERSDKPLALVHPGASVSEKRWPGEAFGRAAAGLLRRGYDVVVTGGAEEQKLTRRVAELAPGAHDLGGSTDLSTLVALAARADIVVSNDTGPAHLAYASGTPSVTLFGPSTDVERWGPLNRRRHTVLFGDPISEVPAEAVVERVEELVLGREEEQLGA